MGRRVLVCVLGAFLVATGCGNKEEVERLQQEARGLRQELKSVEQKLQEAQNNPMLQMAKERFGFLAEQMQGVKARFLTTAGNIEVEFYPEKAPIHCFAFITRAESGFYDGTLFHRVIKNFMLQGGDPLSKDNDPENDGTGGPIVMIPHEFNDLRHTPGILSMARVSDVRAGAGSQFFVMHGTTQHLDGQYTVFGKVTQGMDVVNKVAEMRTGAKDRPVQDVVIKTIEVYR